jgi:hypothetical protein
MHIEFEKTEFKTVFTQKKSTYLAFDRNKILPVETTTSRSNLAKRFNFYGVNLRNTLVRQGVNKKKNRRPEKMTEEFGQAKNYDDHY